MILPLLRTSIAFKLKIFPGAGHRFRHRGRSVLFIGQTQTSLCFVFIGFLFHPRCNHTRDCSTRFGRPPFPIAAYVPLSALKPCDFTAHSLRKYVSMPVLCVHIALLRRPTHFVKSFFKILLFHFTCLPNHWKLCGLRQRAPNALTKRKELLPRHRLFAFHAQGDIKTYLIHVHPIQIINVLVVSHQCSFLQSTVLQSSRIFG